MATTTVVNVKTTSEYDVYIGRGRSTKPGVPSANLGNPFIIGTHGDRAEVMLKYAKYFAFKIAHDQQFKVKIEALRGRTLGCWCKPEACHGDIIAGYLNGTHQDIPAP